MTEELQWLYKKRDYEYEKRKHQNNLLPTIEHPLRGTVFKNVTSTNIRASSNNTTSNVAAINKTPLDDPLNMIMAGDDFIDPLSTMLNTQDAMPTFGRKKQSATTPAQDFGDEDGYIDGTFEPWTSKKASILNRYTTSQKLSITTAYLTSHDKEKLTVKSQTTTTDKLKNRLEQLDDFEEGSIKEMLNLSQTEYVNRIEQLNTTLLQAWKSDQRVKSLKIAIQCAKVLGDTDVIQFYPSKFVLVTDILDNFGKLVFERILDKSVTYIAGTNAQVRLSENFRPDEVPDSAKETCRNWFYKIASIRELVPRLYVEMAILPCYSFLTTGEYSQALLRLCKQIRGIADPLTAVYARAYLCRVGIIVAPKVRDHLNPCWFDYLSTYNQLNQSLVQDQLVKQNLDMPSYLQLFPPALDWLLQCIAYKSSENELSDILKRCKSSNSALILNSILNAFDPKYVAGRALQFNDLVKESEESGFPKYLLYKTLGTCLTMEDPPEESKLTLLNEVWKVVMKLKNPTEYINCAEVWIDYPLKHFSNHEVNTLLGNIIKHMQPERAFEHHYPQLLSILSKVISESKDFKEAFTMDNFLPFFDMFQKESVKVSACKTIMESFKRSGDELSDPVLINSLMSLCKTMHDFINAISLDDDRRVITDLISTFLHRVTFGKDFEKQLNFFVDSRAIFSNLDHVLISLVQSVNLLTNKTKLLVKGNHTRKTASFVRACMAYCFITIPSIGDVFPRLKLYLLSAQTALSNQAIGQADSLFRAAINLLSDTPKTIELDYKHRSSEVFFVEYINNLLSTLLIVPDHPDHDVLYLFRGLLNVIEDYKWEESDDSKLRIYLNALCVLSASCQETFLYQIYKVDSNDVLYGTANKYVAEISKLIQTLTNQILEQLSNLKNPKKQAFLSLAFINRMLSHADVSSPPMIKLVKYLWKLANQSKQADIQMMKRLKETIERRSHANTSYKQLYAAL